jgi:multidrug efflux pump subunit AcrA (membrane-fusion protein)
MKSQPASVPTKQPEEILTPAGAALEAGPQPLETNGSTNGSSRRPSRLPKARTWNRRTKVLALAVLLLVVGSAGAAGYLLIAKPFQNARTDLVVHKVQYGRLELTIIERGALESANNHDIICRVKARSQTAQTSTTIKSLVDDGSHVKKGELLVELDDSGLIDQLKTQKITVDKAESDKIQAEEKYKIDISQNDSDIQTKRTALELAKIDLEKYEKGDFPQKLKDVEGRVKVAESDLEQQRDRAAWAQRMLKKGYYTVSQSESEQSKLQSSELSLAKVVEERRVLTDPTYGEKKRTETDLKNKWVQARDELERTLSSARAKEVQSRTERDTKKSVYEQELSKYKEFEDEIKKCKLYAPADGLVVYFVNEQTRWGVGRQALVAQGEAVAENQKLMQIPDLKHMFVNAKIHEALVSRVHKGQPAMVRVDALQGRRLKAHVEAVANTAAQQDWFAADVKVYATKVSIDEEVEGLKPGMTAEVTITVADALEHVLMVPITAIIGSAEMGETRKCFVMTPFGPEERDVVVGMSNDKDVEIRSGLVAGDEIVTNPKLLVGDKVKTREAGEFARKETDNGGKGGPAGKGPAGKGPAGPQAGGPQAGGPQAGGPQAGGPQAGGGPGGAGKAGGQKGGFQFSAEQMKEMQKKQKEFKDKYDKAKTKDEKKKLVKDALQQVPEAWRDGAKQRMKDQGFEVDD